MKVKCGLEAQKPVVSAFRTLQDSQTDRFSPFLSLQEYRNRASSPVSKLQDCRFLEFSVVSKLQDHQTAGFSALPRLQDRRADGFLTFSCLFFRHRLPPHSDPTHELGIAQPPLTRPAGTLSPAVGEGEDSLRCFAPFAAMESVFIRAIRD
jgi:hypothetical protein